MPEKFDPWFKNGNRALSQILGGWQVSSIVTARSGLPMRVSQASGINNSRADEVPGVNAVLPNWGDTLQYLNKNAFARVPTYPITGATIRPGTQTARHLHGPGRWFVDMSLAKNFRVKESMRVEFRADFFNFLNHVNYSNPDLAITSPTFGLITSAVNPRSGQVGVRFTF
jgi:hypothetical protein